MADKNPLPSRRALLKGAVGVPLVFTVPSGRVWATSSLTCVAKNEQTASTLAEDMRVRGIVNEDNWLRVELPLLQVSAKSGSAWVPIGSFANYIEGFNGNFWGVSSSGSAYTGVETTVSVLTAKANPDQYNVVDTGNRVYAIVYSDASGALIGYGFGKFAGSPRSVSCAASYPVNLGRYRHFGRRVQRV